MKMFTKSRIYIVGKQVVDSSQLDKFFEDENTDWSCTTDVPGQQIPEIAGRICYMSFGTKQGRKENYDYLNHIIGVGHGSVLEHTVYNFIFTGISRSLTHELIRHRAGFGYSQLSQRYVDEEDANFIIPPAMHGDNELTELVTKFCTDSAELYGKLTEKLATKYSEPKKMVEIAIREGVLNYCGNNLYSLDENGDKHNPEFWEEYCKTNDIMEKKTRTARRKAAREAARCVLPNATETKIFVTANARALRHFIELRGDIHAEPEIRALACELCAIMKKEAPNIFGDYEIIKLSDGSERTITNNRKV